MKEKIIYLLEDDQDIQELVCFLLTDDGYKVLAFDKAMAFNQQLEKALPDLFILDITLPDGNGLDISIDLVAHEKTAHIPVLLMSANLHNRKKAIDSGVREFISKPFDIDDLLGRVKLLLAA